MIPAKRVLLKIALIICTLAYLALAGLPVYALEPQENPDTAKLVFSGASLFQFYSSTLDSVLTKNLPEIAAFFQKTPFANIPPALNDTINTFVSSSQEICGRMLELDADINHTKQLLQQSRYEEAAPITDQAFQSLSLAEGNLNTIEQANRNTISQFLNASGGTSSLITTSYTNVVGKIQKLHDSLQLYRNLLTEQQTAIANKNSLQSPVLTLNVTPQQVFVGDMINVDGTLSANGHSLADRQISILLNGSQYKSFKTDAQGHYSGSLQVPYLYVSIMQSQALYYPQTADIGIFNSALSSTTNLIINFYTTKLTLKTEAKAYPGKETAISGQFEYGSSPVPLKRKIEIALDNETVREFEITGNFIENITLPGDTGTGKHLITVSVLASERYAPVSTDTALNVAKAIPVISTKMPSFALIPGSFVINGKLDSEIGPVGGAHITTTFAGNKLDVISGSDGKFTAAFKQNWGFGLFGTQPLVLKITPQEPSQSTASYSYKIMTVYVVNCGIFFFILGFLSVVLPRSLKQKTRERRQRQLSPETSSIVENRSLSSQIAANPNIMANTSIEVKADDNRLFYWYRIVLQLVQKLTGMLVRPNQTLREYIRGTGNVTGPAGKYLLEFTRIVEKALYSPYKVSDADVKNGEKLARSVQESLKK
jgi:hypothetical protein